MSEYNIQMNKYNALNAEYDQLYPQPMKHANTHANGGADPITPGDIGAYSKEETYSKNETDTFLANKADASSVYTKEESISAATRTALSLAETATPDAALSEIARQLSESGNVSMELLWENASPKSDFAAQDITINEMANSKEGDWIAVETVSHGVFFARWSATASSYCFMSYAFYNGSAVEGKRRTWYVVGSRINFTNNSSWTSSGSSTSNSFFVPNKIYRIKCIA